MPKQRSPDRDKAFEIYKERKGNIPLVDIANQLSISEGTVRGWKNKDKWDSKLNGTFQKNIKRSNKNTERSKHKKEKSLTDKKLLESVEDNDTLTEKQKLFCVYYLKNFNATLAAIKAGYSHDSAGRIGYALLQKEYIKVEINKLKAIKKETLMLNSEDIVEQYMKIAFADITDFADFGTDEVKELDENGNKKKYKHNFVRFKDSSDIDGSLISEISVGKNSSTIKLADKMKALEWLSRYFLMYPMDKHKIEYDNKKFELEQRKATSNEDKLNSLNQETKVTIYIPDNKRDSGG